MKKLIGIIILILILLSCSRTEGPHITTYNGVTIRFRHLVNNSELKKDTLKYVNAAGQQYMVNDLQYFISSVKFHKCNGNWYEIKSDDGLHYTDIDIPSTCDWEIKDILPEGCYDSLSFIFGLDENDNISNRFPDPPMRDMFWPEVLGGGYHYMKMNLKWKNDTMSEQRPFMMHLGIGQIYSQPGSNPGDIIGFIQNYFPVVMPFNLIIDHSVATEFTIKMNIGKWFSGDNVFDLSQYPMGIMQNQEGMFRAIQNGRNAFSL